MTERIRRTGGQTSHAQKRWGLLVVGGLATAVACGAPASDTDAAPGQQATAPVDTARPPFAEDGGFTPDTMYIAVFEEDPRWSYFRRLARSIFVEDASGPQIREFLTRHDGTVVGGVEGTQEYVVRFEADPGPTVTHIQEFHSRLIADPVAETVTLVQATRPVGRPN